MLPWVRQHQTLLSVQSQSFGNIGGVFHWPALASDPSDKLAGCNSFIGGGSAPQSVAVGGAKELTGLVLTSVPGAGTTQTCPSSGGL